MISQQRLDNVWRLLAARRVRGWGAMTYEGLDVLTRLDPHSVWIRRSLDVGPWMRLTDRSDAGRADRDGVGQRTPEAESKQDAS